MFVFLRKTLSELTLRNRLLHQTTSVVLTVFLKNVTLQILIRRCNKAYCITLRNQAKDPTFENRDLRRIFWAKCDESAESIGLKNEQFHSLFVNII